MKRIIVMGIPHHGNIGDNAIAVAEEELLAKYFSDYKIYYMQEKYLDICAKKAKKYINDEDVILLHGGGNIGDTYERPEKGRREVIKLYPNNKIIIFPQTAYFSDTEKGKKELEISKQIYNNHKNLVILAREEKSYNFMKEHFYNTKVYLTPDIVMTLYKANKLCEKRNGVLFLFRTDEEKTLNDKQVKELVNTKYGRVTTSDMNLGKGIVKIGGKLRDELLENKFNQLKEHKLVITDRLHGMIFAAITETPCITFGNFNHKISESYKWLKNLKYIQYSDDINNLANQLEKIEKLAPEDIKYDNMFAEKCIADIMLKEIC